MPRYGFSGQKADMRKLIIFAARAIEEPVDEIGLTTLVLLDDDADYFLFADSLDSLISSGLLERHNHLLSLSPRGEEIADITERDLPAALRRAVMAESEQIRERLMRKRCITAEILETAYETTFRGLLTDGKSPLLELKLQTGGRRHAEMLCRRFEKDAEAILADIWETLSK